MAVRKDTPIGFGDPLFHGSIKPAEDPLNVGIYKPGPVMSYEVAELLNWQAIREEARKRR